MNLNCVLSQMAINGTCEATLTRPQNSYPILARGLEGFNTLHVAGRPLGHQSSREAGSVLVRPRSGLLQEPCLHASEGRRGSHIEQLRRFEIIKKARKREDEKTRARDLSFFQAPIVYAQQRLSRSGSVGAGPRGGGPTRNSITRSKGAEPGGA